LARWDIKSVVEWVGVEYWLLFLIEPRFVFRESRLEMQHIGIYCEGERFGLESVLDGHAVAVQRDTAGRRGNWRRPSSVLIRLLVLGKRGHRRGNFLISEICGGLRFHANGCLTVRAIEWCWPGLKTTVANWSRSRADIAWLEDPVQICEEFVGGGDSIV
jgi:hypothetical protein